jgi:hypothetical protein
MTMMFRATCAAIAASCVLGCAHDSTARPPTDAWVAVEAEVGRAEASDAPREPDAMQQLQLARRDLWRARALMGRDDARAATLTELARTEVQLALSLTRAAAADDDARRAATELQAEVGR